MAESTTRETIQITSEKFNSDNWPCKTRDQGPSPRPGPWGAQPWGHTTSFSVSPLSPFSSLLPRVSLSLDTPPPRCKLPTSLSVISIGFLPQRNPQQISLHFLTRKSLLNRLSLPLLLNFCNFGCYYRGSSRIRGRLRAVPFTTDMLELSFLKYSWNYGF